MESIYQPIIPYSGAVRSLNPISSRILITSYIDSLLRTGRDTPKWRWRYSGKESGRETGRRQRNYYETRTRRNGPIDPGEQSVRVQLSKDQSLRYGDLFPKGSTHTHTTEGEEKKNERRGNDIRTEGVKVEAEKIHSGGGGGAWENAQQSTGEEEEGRRGFDTVKVLKKGDVEKKKFHDNNQNIPRQESIRTGQPLSLLLPSSHGRFLFRVLTRQWLIMATASEKKCGWNNICPTIDGPECFNPVLLKTRVVRIGRSPSTDGDSSFAHTTLPVTKRRDIRKEKVVCALTKNRAAT